MNNKEILKENSMDDFMTNYGKELNTTANKFNTVVSKANKWFQTTKKDVDKIADGLVRDLSNYDNNIVKWIDNIIGTGTTNLSARDIATKAISNYNSTGTEPKFVIDALEDAISYMDKNFKESISNKEILKEKFNNLQEENKMLKEQYEEDMNKVVSILEKLKEEVDMLKKEQEEDEEVVVAENVTEETEEESMDEEPKKVEKKKKESAETPQDEDAVNKNLEQLEEEPKKVEKKKKESAETPQDEDAVNKNLESAETPQDEDAVNKNLEQLEEEPKKEMEDELTEAEEEEPKPPISEKLSLNDLYKRNDKFNNHLREMFKF